MRKKKEQEKKCIVVGTGKIYGVAGMWVHRCYERL